MNESSVLELSDEEFVEIVKKRRSLQGRRIPMNEYWKPTEDLIPELILKGTVSEEEIMTDDGRLVTLKIITYQKRRFVMKKVSEKRWRDKCERGGPAIGASWHEEVKSYSLEDSGWLI